MATVRVICPNHGVIARIEMACMWMGRPPMPETDNRFCPKCGACTVIERDPEITSVSWGYRQTNDNDYKAIEIDYYRKKYKKEFNL